MYRITEHLDGIQGAKAFFKRFRQCRPEYFIYLKGSEFEMRLHTGEIIQENEIAERLLMPLRITIQGKMKNLNPKP